MYIERCKHGSERGWNRPTVEILQGDSFLLYNANKAVELGFADGIMYQSEETAVEDSYSFSQREVSNILINKLKAKSGVKISDLEKRLNLIK